MKCSKAASGGGDGPGVELAEQSSVKSSQEMITGESRDQMNERQGPVPIKELCPRLRFEHGLVLVLVWRERLRALRCWGCDV